MDLQFGVLAVVVCAVTAALAARKGYNPAIWFFTAGIPGLLVLAFLPFTNKGERPSDQEERRRSRGNKIGLIVIAAGLVAALALRF